MMISIALCTYHGSAYLKDQLQSLATQSRLPEELVICDDHSQDQTVQLLREFSAQAPFPVKVVVNESNRGTAKNFAQAISLCRGEIIALCDQDDIWHPDKLARMEAVFLSNPTVGLVFSDAVLMDSQGQVLNERLWSAFGFSELQQRQMQRGDSFASLLALNIVTGAAMAFRSEFTSLILPIPYERPLLHDAWIALLIAAVAELGLISEPLIFYRQHAAQQTRLNVSPKCVRSQDHYRDQVRQLKAVAERLADQGPLYHAPRLPVALKTLQKKIDHVQTRVGLPTSYSQRLPLVLRELLTGHYHRYSNGWRSVVRDLLR